MSELMVAKVSGTGELVNPTSGAALENPPAAQTKGVNLGERHIRWRKASPYWEITEYTTEQFNAFLEADELSPELAEHYKDLLED